MITEKDKLKIPLLCDFEIVFLGATHLKLS